jgi:hypothetical protein
MKPNGQRKRPVRKCLIAMVLIVAVIAATAILALSQLPQVPAPFEVSPDSALTSATLNASRFSVEGAYGGGGFNVSSAPCSRAAPLTFECNVTLFTVPIGSCGTCAVAFLNYTDLGSGAVPSNFYFINSDPTLPLVLPTGCTRTCTETLAMWFQVTPHSGTISAFIEFQS